MKIDRNGSFKVDLPPGRYRLFQMNDGPPQTVTVEPGKYTKVNLPIQAL